MKTRVRKKDAEAAKDRVLRSFDTVQRKTDAEAAAIAAGKETWGEAPATARQALLNAEELTFVRLAPPLPERLSGSPFRFEARDGFFAALGILVGFALARR